MRNTNRVSLVLAIATACLGLAWVLFSKYLVPRLIVQAYRGESLSLFNRIINGQAIHPLADYLSAWKVMSWDVFLSLIAIGLLAALLNLPACKQFWAGTIVPIDKTSSAIVPMTWQRKLVVYTLLALVFGGSLFDVITYKEHWPFSRYSMYAVEEKDRSLVRFRLFGVTQEKPLAEFPLEQYQYTQPFDNSRLDIAFVQLDGDLRLHNELLRDAVRDCLIRYEALRRAGRHNGPPLEAMRLYKVYWVLDPWARNVDHPDRKDLRVEVTAAEAKER